MNAIILLLPYAQIILLIILLIVLALLSKKNTFLKQYIPTILSAIIHTEITVPNTGKTATAHAKGSQKKLETAVKTIKTVAKDIKEPKKGWAYYVEKYLPLAISMIPKK